MQPSEQLHEAVQADEEPLKLTGELAKLERRLKKGTVFTLRRMQIYASSGMTKERVTKKKVKQFEVRRGPMGKPTLFVHFGKPDRWFKVGPGHFATFVVSNLAQNPPLKYEVEAIDGKAV